MSKTLRATEKIQLSAADWEQAALDTISQKGVAAIAVESLARTLGVTKGSFYWHFQNRNSLIESALNRWEQEDINTFARSFDIIRDPADKLRALFRRTRQEIQSHLIFSALFRATDHPLVQQIMQRVSERRIDYLTSSYSELGLSDREAVNRARLTYLSYVGFLQYYQQFKSVRMSAEEVSEYMEHVISTLIPAEPAA